MSKKHAVRQDEGCRVLNMLTVVPLPYPGYILYRHYIGTGTAAAVVSTINRDYDLITRKE
jgi:hypothetical protein